MQWCFSQVKGTLDDDVTEADIISCVEFNQDGDLLATGDKGGRVVIFQRDPQVGKEDKERKAMQLWQQGGSTSTKHQMVKVIEFIGAYFIQWDISFMFPQF